MDTNRAIKLFRLQEPLFRLQNLLMFTLTPFHAPAPDADVVLLSIVTLPLVGKRRSHAVRLTPSKHDFGTHGYVLSSRTCRSRSASAKVTWRCFAYNDSGASDDATSKSWSFLSRWSASVCATDVAPPQLADEAYLSAGRNDSWSCAAEAVRLLVLQEQDSEGFISRSHLVKYAEHRVPPELHSNIA